MYEMSSITTNTGQVPLYIIIRFLAVTLTKNTPPLAIWPVRNTFGLRFVQTNYFDYKYFIDAPKLLRQVSLFDFVEIVCKQTEKFCQVVLDVEERTK
jgi:hypothetical protein